MVGIGLVDSHVDKLNVGSVKYNIDFEIITAV